MSFTKPEVIHKPHVFEIHPDKNGKPYLKKVERSRNIREEGRGRWMPVGKMTDSNIEKVVRINRRTSGLICLPDQDGIFRVLVLTD